MLSLLMLTPQVQIDALDNNNLTAQAILANITLTPGQLARQQSLAERAARESLDQFRNCHKQYEYFLPFLYDSCRKVVLTGKENGWIKHHNILTSIYHFYNIKMHSNYLFCPFLK